MLLCLQYRHDAEWHYNEATGVRRDMVVHLQERARRRKQASKGQQKRLPAVSSVIQDFDEDEDDDYEDDDYED